VLIALLCVAGFWELAEDFAASPSVAAFDAGVSSAIIALRGPALTLVARIVTTTGDTLTVTLATTVLLFFLWRRRHRFTVSALVAITGGALVANLLKGRFGRPRPSAVDALITLPASFSFPSGHAMSSLCVAGVVSYLAGRSAMSRGAKITAISALLVWAMAVGLSRVYLGVHWPSDVLASWLLGIGWLALLIGYSEARREVPQARPPAGTAG